MEKSEPHKIRIKSAMQVRGLEGIEHHAHNQGGAVK